MSPTTATTSVSRSPTPPVPTTATTTPPSSTPRRRSFAVIGCGEIARNQHIPIILHRSDSRLGAVVDVLDPDVVRSNDVAGVLPPETPIYRTLGEALEAANSASASSSSSSIDAVVVCTPPEYAQSYIREALEAGLDVFAEKPPGLDESVLVDELLPLAEASSSSYHSSLYSDSGAGAGAGADSSDASRGDEYGHDDDGDNNDERDNRWRHGRSTLFTAYHSTECPAMDAAREWIHRNGPVVDICITWKEDASKWHGGQEWIAKGTFGVMDILINPLSMVLRLLGRSASEDMDVVAIEGVASSEIHVPENWNGPLSGRTELTCDGGRCRILAEYDWSYRGGNDDNDKNDVDGGSDSGDEIWTIRFRTKVGECMEVTDGGAQMYAWNEEFENVDNDENQKDARPQTRADGRRRNKMRVTTEPTSVDKIRPEYERLHDKFARLIDSGRVCEVDVAPLRVANRILRLSRIVRVGPYCLR